MKAEEIVKQLMAALPPQTDLFTDSIGVTGITSSGTTASVNATAHELVVGSLFTICDAQTNMVIEEIVRDGEVASARTAENHDLTFDEIQIEAQGAPLTITISGATEPEFNGTFELLSVPNRRHFQFKMVDAGAVESTGSPVLVDGYAYSYNGTFNVTNVIDDDNFEYTLPFPDLPDAAGTIILKKDYRISRIVNFERAVDAYTKQDQQKLWLFIETNDGAASKDRKTQSDATAVLGRTNNFRQQVIFPFTVYCFGNVTEQVSGGARKDQMRDVMLFLFRSLLGKVFGTTLSCDSENQVVFVSDGSIFYDSATYAHAFQFETVNDISFGDSIGFDFNVAFRDIELGFDPVFDIGE